MAEVIMAKSGYSRLHSEGAKPYLPLTFEEVVLLGYGDHVLVLTYQNVIRKVKINGKPKTWKRRPKDCSVPWKYGMYEYGRTEYRAGEHVSGPMFVKFVGS